MNRFKAVPGFENYYATKDGYVYKLNEYDEYDIVGTYPKDGSTPLVWIDEKRFTVAKIVALTFIPNDISENAVVFHLDLNKWNNSVENLVWVTPGELRRMTSRKNLPELYKSYLKVLRENE